jgi:hypothetical protein
MEVFGVVIPLWAIFLIAIIAVIVVWKLIKFAIKALIVIVIVFVIIMGLDALQVFDWLRNLITVIVPFMFI